VPEGDTIHRIARRMGQDLVGQRVVGLTLQAIGEVHELEGKAVSGVEARGKHLLVHFDGGWSLRVHLGMKGRWRRAPSSRTSHPGPSTASVHLVSSSVAWTCGGAYQAELVRTGHIGGPPRLSRLGPDLLSPTPDVAAAERRSPGSCRTVAARTIARHASLPNRSGPDHDHDPSSPMTSAGPP